MLAGCWQDGFIAGPRYRGIIFVGSLSLEDDNGYTEHCLFLLSAQSVGERPPKKFQACWTLLESAAFAAP
jgi:hypothetical protein